MENIINDIFSDILEQSAITVVISHQNTLRHCAAVELRYLNQLNRTELGLNVILRLFLKSAEIPLLSKRLVLMFLVSKEHTRVSLVSTNFVTFFFTYTSRHPPKTESFWLLPLKMWMTLGNLFVS